MTNQHRAFGGVARNLSHPDGLVAPDLRDRGDSAKPPSGNYGLDAHASDVVRILDFLGIDRGVLAGHSTGAYVALRTALSHPDRIKDLVLFDGGWPRPEGVTELDEATREGLEPAMERLGVIFESPDDYLDHWFPDQNLALEDLPPDLADYYLYDLERTEGGYRPKASREAAEEDLDSFSSEGPTAALGGVGCPVALVRAAEGFPGGDPLVPDETRRHSPDALDLCSEPLLSGAKHYSMLFSEHAQQTAGIIDDFLRRIG